MPLLPAAGLRHAGFFVFMLIQFLRGVPRDMKKAAAQIGGCNSLQVLAYVVVPSANRPHYLHHLRPVPVHGQ